MTLKVDFTPEQKEALRMFESVVESYDLRALGCGRWLWAVVRNPIFL